MILKRIALHQFRNIEKKIVSLSPQLTILLGENARGKTNILESIYVGVNGEGFRETKEDELIMMDKNETQIDLLFHSKNQDRQFRVHFSRGKDGKTTKRTYVEKVLKSITQYQELMTRAVLFSPEQIDIIIGAPDIRRAYFNTVIGQIDPVYKKHLTNYEQALRKRNKILEFHSSPEKLADELLFWDAYLVKEAEYITKSREWYVAYLNAHCAVDSQTFSAEYVKNEFSLERLAEKKNLEMRLRKTLIGPQKDDFVFSLRNKHGHQKNIHKYGSRSEQRMTVFWLKLIEILHCEERLKIIPLLLLDDVFSEFDHDNKERILGLIKKYQSVMTTTENERIQKLQKEQANVAVVQL